MTNNGQAGLLITGTIAILFFVLLLFIGISQRIDALETHVQLLGDVLIELIETLIESEASNLPSTYPKNGPI